MEPHSFWKTLAGKEGQYNDLQFIVLRANGFKHSNADMYAAWSSQGKPALTPVV